MIDGADAPEAHAVASKVRPEFVVTAVGKIAKRLEGTENKRLATGAIELQATELTILNESKTPPFYINEPEAVIDEALRLKYRYLDLRREPMAERLLLRSKLVHAIRPWRMSACRGAKVALELPVGAIERAGVVVGDHLVIEHT